MKLNTENVVGIGIFIFLFAYPLFVSPYNVMNLTYFLSMVFLSLSVSLIWGYTGIFSFGQAAFFGVGGYFYALFTMNNNVPSMTPVGLVLGVLAGALVALIIGYLMFYGGINDVFVGLITLCITVVFETFMAQTAGSQWKIGDVGLGGYNGINGIPNLSFGSFNLIGNSFYYFVLILFLLIYLGLRLFIKSKYGYAVIAIRENRERTKLFGYNVPKIQMFVFTVGGALASLSGILYAMWGSYMTPSVVGLTASTLPVVLVAAGGRKNLTASVIFTLVYYWFSQSLSASGNEYALIILGVALILVILFVPEGIFVALFNLSDKLFLNKIKVFKLSKKESLHEQRTNQRS